MSKQTEPEHMEPQVYCDSCWWCDGISGDSRFGVVMYCHYHKKPRVNYHTCDEYENADMVEFPDMLEFGIPADDIRADDYLASLGFDPEATYDVPKNPSDAALTGVAAFVREHSLEHSVTIAAELLEKHTNMCPREWYEVPWDCNVKCDNDLTQCWFDYLEHEGVRRFVQRAEAVE